MAPTVKILEWRGVAFRSLGKAGDKCGVCKLQLNARCADCEKSPHAICSIARLSCGHSFHEHCVESWFSKNTKKICPLCKAEVKFEKK